MGAVSPHAAEHVVHDGADTSEEHGTTRQQALDRAYVGQREREPGDECNHGGDEDGHDERPRRVTTFGAQLHGVDPYIIYL